MAHPALPAWCSALASSGWDRRSIGARFVTCWAACFRRARTRSSRFPFTTRSAERSCSALAAVRARVRTAVRDTVVLRPLRFWSASGTRLGPDQFRRRRHRGAAGPLARGRRIASWARCRCCGFRCRCSGSRGITRQAGQAGRVGQVGRAGRPQHVTARQEPVLVVARSRGPPSGRTTARAGARRRPCGRSQGNRAGAAPRSAPR